MDRKLGGLAVALVLVLGQAHAQQVTDEVDRFTGERKLGYTSPGKAQLGVPILSFFATQGGKTPVNGIKFMIAPDVGRYGVQQGMQYIGCKQVNWLIDGRPTELGPVVHSFNRYDRVLVEFVIQEASTDQLATIGSANEVEYRICGTEGRLSTQDIAAAREIAGRLRGGEPTPPSSVDGAPRQEGGMNYRPKWP